MFRFSYTFLYIILSIVLNDCASFEKMDRDYSAKSTEFIRAVAEGDLVALHTPQTWPGNEQYVTMDFFRFDDSGKIVEHWDSIQTVPGETKNGNLMY